jgi:hypothetical protein
MIKGIHIVLTSVDDVVAHRLLSLVLFDEDDSGWTDVISGTEPNTSFIHWIYFGRSECFSFMSAYRPLAQPRSSVL